MQYVILVIGRIHDGVVINQYLRSANHDTYGGVGSVSFTSNIKEAMKFDTTHDAFEFWRRPSTVRPVRDDGKPNRPLTAFTVAITPL